MVIAAPRAALRVFPVAALPTLWAPLAPTALNRVPGLVPPAELAPILDRLSKYADRLRDSAYRAIQLHTIYLTYNAPDNPMKVSGVANKPGASAATFNALMDAAIRELVLILVRVFDEPRPRRDVWASDKVSFPVLVALADKPGVRDFLRLAAREWFEDGFNANKNEEDVDGAYIQIATSVAQLRSEEPNRCRKLRQFRDEFLAHELHIDGPRDRPIYDDLTAITAEVERLAKAGQMAFRGCLLGFETLHLSAANSANELWRCIARGQLL